MIVPDVTVILAVYNAMPYLTDCLGSVVEQTIGLDRLEVVAVDDGSTDGSDKELERFTDLYPGVFKTFRQPNSGGPARPNNRALDNATGRFVFFLGADDYLGTEALERLVAAADKWDSDVVLGKMVGVNGRSVPKAVFAKTRSEITLFDSPLPWALSNTKLFRRSHIEQLGLRYIEHLPIASDQAFTLPACIQGKVSALADYDYYFAVSRSDDFHVTTRATTLEWMFFAEWMMGFVDLLVGTQEQREAIIVRHFIGEIGLRFDDGFLSLSREDQERFCGSVRRVMDTYCSPTLWPRFSVELRIRLRLAATARIDGLIALLRLPQLDAPSILVEGDRAFEQHMCFRDPAWALPDDCFDVTKRTIRRISGKHVSVKSVAWKGSSALEVVAQSSLHDFAIFGPGVVRLIAESNSGRRVDVSSADLEFRLPVRYLFGRTTERWRLTLAFESLGARVETVVVPPRRTFRSVGLPGVYRVSAGKKGVTTKPISLVRALARRLRPVPSRQVASVAWEGFHRALRWLIVRRPHIPGDRYKLAPAVATELEIADSAYLEGNFPTAAQSLEKALGLLFHRGLHLDRLSSPLADAPGEFTAPLRTSTAAGVLSAPRGREAFCRTAKLSKLLIVTHGNTNFVGEIRSRYENNPDLEVRYLDLRDEPDLHDVMRRPRLLIEDVLSGGATCREKVEEALRPYLDWADTVFVDWCVSAPALVTLIDPRETRVIVRLHSYEAFTMWPQLIDFSRVDHLVFVGDHLRELVTGMLPRLSASDAPRLHTLTNAVELKRFSTSKGADARFNVGLIGVGQIAKDPGWALEVLRLLRAKDARYRLFILGRPLEAHGSEAAQEYARKYARELAELTAAGAVRELGHVDDMPAALGDIGTILSSSVRESFHCGLVEGAASGAVPVVRDWPFFAHQRTGARTLFPSDWVVDTPRQAADRILGTTSHEEVWRSTGLAASLHALTTWDWTMVAPTYDALFLQTPPG